MEKLAREMPDPVGRQLDLVAEVEVGVDVLLLLLLLVVGGTKAQKDTWRLLVEDVLTDFQCTVSALAGRLAGLRLKLLASVCFICACRSLNSANRLSAGRLDVALAAGWLDGC